ncbi:Protein of unknown function [Lactobacillus delbrueckii subsp. lactis]|nr:Protein of unknown function [Lactobacillus delbrueckii subsp. lactis]
MKVWMRVRRDKEMNSGCAAQY